MSDQGDPIWPPTWIAIGGHDPLRVGEGAQLLGVDCVLRQALHRSRVRDVGPEMRQAGVIFHPAGPVRRTEDEQVTLGGGEAPAPRLAGLDRIRLEVLVADVPPVAPQMHALGI